MERLRDLSEAELLGRLAPVYAGVPHRAADVPVGPGDDAAVVATPSGSVVASVDAMVRGSDWRDDWSSAHDVGVKVTAQNLADIAAMGAVPTGLLISLAADPETGVEWAVDLARGIASMATDAGAAVIGGDLSSAPAGVVVVSVTALGDLQGRTPVLRSGARVGDVVAVCGSLGRSGGGLALYQAGEDVAGVAGREAPAAGRALVVADLKAYHRAPRPPWESGPVAAIAGVHALIDVSDGLVTDAARLAAASGVRLDLDGRVLTERYAAGPLTEALGAGAAFVQVLSGGEEHALLGCFDPDVDLTALAGEPWHVVGAVVPADPGGVTVDGVVPEVRGWDHFAG